LSLRKQQSAWRTIPAVIRHSLGIFAGRIARPHEIAAMPTVLRKNGFEFFFWSNDHSPAHIHVFKAGGEAKFNLEPLVELVYTRGMKVADISQAQRLVKQHHALLLKAFQDHENRK
jgi:hypothetical protein